MSEKAKASDAKQSDLTELLCSSGQQLEQIRYGLGLSLAEAADLIGCTKSHLHDIEKGRSSNPGANLLSGICRAYSLSAETVLDMFAPRKPVEKGLFAVKVNGPDSIIATESYAIAEWRANTLNSMFRDDDFLSADVILWPFERDCHAESCKNADWLDIG